MLCIYLSGHGKYDKRNVARSSTTLVLNLTSWNCLSADEGLYINENPRMLYDWQEGQSHWSIFKV